MKRLVSLDFFRGLTVALMILVNSPGSWSHVYPPLLHADWHGVTPTDLVFPFFLFIVGVSIALAYHKKKMDGVISSSTYIKILRRTAILFILGLFLALFPSFDFSNLRVVGVLQRIAIVFLFCSLLFLNFNWRNQLLICITLLFLYFIAMCYVPVPGVGKGILEPGKNMAAWIDSFLVPGRMYQKTWDPEGFFSTLPAISTGITGLLIGQILTNRNTSQEQKVIWIFFGGFLTFIIGYMWGWVFPLNKHIWTSSYVLFTSGLAAMTLAASMWYIDGLNKRSYTFVGVVFGMNAIAAYVLHGVLWRIFNLGDPGLQRAFMAFYESIGVNMKLASLFWAVFYTSLCFLFAWILYRRKIFIKV